MQISNCAGSNAAKSLQQVVYNQANMAEPAEEAPQEEKTKLVIADDIDNLPPKSDCGDSDEDEENDDGGIARHRLVDRSMSVCGGGWLVITRIYIQRTRFTQTSP